MTTLKSRLKYLPLLMMGVVATAYAEGEHNSQSQNIDINAPIVALDKLESLKTTQPLNVTIPKIEHFTTKNGTPVAFVKTDNLPIVDITMYFNAGSARDEAIKKDGFGIASLTATMLKKGIPQKNEDQLAEAVEQLGIGLSTDAYKDMFTVSLRSLSDNKHLDPALGLMADIISKPTFPAESLKRVKSQYLVGLQQEQEDIDKIADKAFVKALYGNHPYAHPTDGTPSSIPTIDREDLVKFHQQFLVAKNANIAITGNVSLEQAKAIANQLTSVLPTGQPAPKLPDAKPLTSSKTIHIPFDSQQTSVIIGQIGRERSNQIEGLKRQVNFSLANDIVGGSNFQARLMSDIRNKRGLTYGIYSGMSLMQSQGDYSISFSTRNDKAKEAIDATLATVKDVVKNGVTQRELDLTKDSFVNSFPLNFASNSAINSTIGNMGFYRVPDNALSDGLQWTKDATLSAVNQQYRSVVTPDKFLIVTVGKSMTDSPASADTNAKKKP